MLSYLKILCLLTIIQIVFASGISSQKKKKKHMSSRAKYQNRIVGGATVDISDVPYLVEVLHRGENHCGGSIISSTWVISAGHCGQDKKKNQLTVRAGSSYWASGGKIYHIKNMIVHEKYGFYGNDFDYMLLELKKPLTHNRNMKIVSLPELNEEIEADVQCIVSGWGLTHNDAEGNTKVRSVVVPIIENTECAENYASMEIDISEYMICAGYPNGKMDACAGDSGGPLVCGDTLYGVVSFGVGCADPGHPGVYAKVSAVRDWIEDYTGV